MHTIHRPIPTGHSWDWEKPLPSIDEGTMQQHGEGGGPTTPTSLTSQGETGGSNIGGRGLRNPFLRNPFFIKIFHFFYMWKGNWFFMLLLESNSIFLWIHFSGASIMLAELAMEAGLPNGVLNIVHGTNVYSIPLFSFLIWLNDCLEDINLWFFWCCFDITTCGISSIVWQDIVNSICDDDDIRAVSFVGSNTVSYLIAFISWT